MCNCYKTFNRPCGRFWWGYHHQWPGLKCTLMKVNKLEVEQSVNRTIHWNKLEDLISTGETEFNLTLQYLKHFRRCLLLLHMRSHGDIRSGPPFSEITIKHKHHWCRHVLSPLFVWPHKECTHKKYQWVEVALFNTIYTPICHLL